MLIAVFEFDSAEERRAGQGLLIYLSGAGECSRDF